MEDKRLENQINPGLTFGLLKGKAEAFAKGEITSEEISNWGDTLVVLSSLPMAIKTTCLISLLTKYFYSDTEEQSIIVAELYRNLFFELYLRYLGIEMVYPEELTYENYDLMEPLYGPWLEAIAGRDIAKFKEMLTNAISLSGTMRLIDTLDLVDTEELRAINKENQEILKALEQNQDFAKTLKEIMLFNDPSLKEALQKMSNGALLKEE